MSFLPAVPPPPHVLLQGAARHPARLLRHSGMAAALAGHKKPGGAGGKVIHMLRTHYRKVNLPAYRTLAKPDLKSSGQRETQAVYESLLMKRDIEMEQMQTIDACFVHLCLVAPGLRMDSLVVYVYI